MEGQVAAHMDSLLGREEPQHPGDTGMRNMARKD